MRYNLKIWKKDFFQKPRQIWIKENGEETMTVVSPMRAMKIMGRNSPLRTSKTVSKIFKKIKKAGSWSDGSVIKSECYSFKGWVWFSNVRIQRL